MRNVSLKVLEKSLKFLFKKGYEPCASNLCAREKRKRTTVQADSQGHVSHYHELMSRVWPVNAYFLHLPLMLMYM